MGKEIWGGGENWEMRNLTFTKKFKIVYEKSEILDVHVDDY